MTRNDVRLISEAPELRKAQAMAANAVKKMVDS